MNTGKECPQCGTEFYGRANKIYCSDRCKMEAFQEGKTKSNLDEPNETSHFSNNFNLDMNNSQNLNSKEIFELQIELKRLEMQKEIDIAEIRRNEKADERNFELMQLEKSYQKQETALKARIFTLEEKYNQLIQENNEIQQKLQSQLNKKEKNQIVPVLDDELKEEFVELMESALEIEGRKFYKKNILIGIDQINVLVKQIRDATYPNQSKVREYQYTSRLLNLFKDNLIEIERKGFWDSKYIEFEIPDKLREDLSEYIEKFRDC